MTLLDDIITASTDTARSTPDLLRMVQVVARRVGASEIGTWVKSEVHGYSADADLPPYRTIHTNVRGIYSGPFNSEIPYDLTLQPKGLESLWRADLRQPLAELQSLSTAQGDSDPTIPWPAVAIEAYERLGGMRIANHGLFKAHQKITRQALVGIIDSIRSKALDFALDLQERFPDAGEKDGPTVATTPALAQTIGTLTVNLTGHGNNLGFGSDIDQRSRVRVGDHAALHRAATQAGLSTSDADEFVAAVEEERDPEGPRVGSVIERVRSGAISLSGAFAADAAAGLLVDAVARYLGLS